MREELLAELNFVPSKLKIDREVENHGLPCFQITLIKDGQEHIFWFAHANHMTPIHMAIVINSYLEG